MKIGLVASELLGAHKNGGIGTATSHLAVLFADRGHEVTVVYIGGDPIDYAHPWIKRLAGHSIEILRLVTTGIEIYPEWTRESSVVFENIRNLEFDLVLFQDWDGCGYASIVARMAGLAFGATRLGVIAHGPTEWLIDANRTAVRSQRTLAKIQMESTAFANADMIICPSRHMKDWVGSRYGERILEKTEALPLYLWSDADIKSLPVAEIGLLKVDRLAFFGRFEERKGIGIFLDAILSDSLAFSDLDILFVGKAASHQVDEIRSTILARRPWLLPRTEFLTDLDSDAAQSAIIDRQSLAIIPSLIDNAPCVISECLRRRIPFISTRVGGIPELIDESDHARVLVEPTSRHLASRLADVSQMPFQCAKPAYCEPQVAALWSDWLERIAPQAVERVADAGAQILAHRDRNTPAAPSVMEASAHEHPLVSVIVTHYERPTLVLGALESLAAQNFDNFEVVLVDDGSESARTMAELIDLENRPWPFRFRLVRKPNGYLGAARNTGIQASDAPFLIFMDDDNVAFPNMIETFYLAATTTHCDIITSQMLIFRQPEGHPDAALIDGGERWSFTAGPAELGLSINCYGDATGIYRRTVFDAIGHFHEWRGIGHEDWHLHARANLAGLKQLSLPVALFWYRRLDTGMLNTTDRYTNNRIIWDVFRRHLPPELSRMVDLSIRNDLVD